MAYALYWMVAGSVMADNPTSIIDIIIAHKNPIPTKLALLQGTHIASFIQPLSIAEISA